MKKSFKILASISLVICILLSLAACNMKPQSEQLIGKWTDSAQTSGYEFHEGGTVTITYIDVVIPVLKLPFNGTITGAYETSTVKEDNAEKNIITFNYTLFSQTISKSYEYKVKGDVLTLIDSEENETTTYMRTAIENTASQKETTKTENKNDTVKDEPQKDNVKNDEIDKTEKVKDNKDKNDKIKNDKSKDDKEKEDVTNNENVTESKIQLGDLLKDKVNNKDADNKNSSDSNSSSDSINKFF